MNREYKNNNNYMENSIKFVKGTELLIFFLKKLLLAYDLLNIFKV